MSRTLCTLNVNGLRAAAKRGFGDWLARKRPDVLCLQEVRARPEQVSDELRSPAGYSTRWLWAEKRGYSGVALYSREAADAYLPGCGIDWADREGRVLRGDFGDEVIVSTYVPSGSSSEERQALKFSFLDAFPRFTRKLLKLDRPVALCGDVNIAHTELDIHAPKRNEKNSGFLPEERAWMEQLFGERGWADVHRRLAPEATGEAYTWWSNRGRAFENNTGWRIDYQVATPGLAARAHAAVVHRLPRFSDHAPLVVDYDHPL